MTIPLPLKSQDCLVKNCHDHVFLGMSATTYANKNATCVSMTATSGDYKVSFWVWGRASMGQEGNVFHSFLGCFIF